MRVGPIKTLSIREMQAMAVPAAALMAGVVLNIVVIACAHADDAMGVWLRGDGAVHARFAPCGSDLCATNVWVKDSASDEKVGDQLVFNVHKEGANKLVGTGYDPKRKVSMTANITVAGDRLATEGCVAGGLICKSVSWTRIR